MIYGYPWLFERNTATDRMDEKSGKVFSDTSTDELVRWALQNGIDTSWRHGDHFDLWGREWVKVTRGRGRTTLTHLSREDGIARHGRFRRRCRAEARTQESSCSL